MIRLAVALSLVPAVAFAGPRCPTGKALHAKAQAAWNEIDGSELGPDHPHRDVSKADLACVEVHGNEPALLIFDKNGALLIGKSVTWHRIDPDCTPGSSHAYQAEDLDGDGTDEVIVTEDYWGHMGYGSQSLSIEHVVGGELTGGGKTQRLGWTDGEHEHNNCWATVRVVAGPGTTNLVEVTGITGEERGRVKPEAESCALPGPRRYRWAHDKLVLVKD